MLKNNHLFLALLACVLILPDPRSVFAQGRGFGASRAQEPLQVVVDSGSGQPKRRVSLEDSIGPIGLPVGQPVTITLQFLPKRAGENAFITSLDGGQIDIEGPVTIAGDGTLVFHFQSGATPGLYRVAVAGPGDYQLFLYAFDPNRPRTAPNP